MVTFRNIAATPDDPVAGWGFEGLLTAIERGGMKVWSRIAAEVRRHPYGAVARLLENEVIDAVSPEGERALFRQVLIRARRSAELDARTEVAMRLRSLVARSGLSQRDFAAELGTSASRLNTYLTGKVTPGADLLVRAEGIARNQSTTKRRRRSTATALPVP